MSFQDCGDFDELARFADKCGKTFYWDMHDALKNIKLTWKDHLGARESPSRKELLDLLRTFRGQQCSDPRDRVYAVLGLAVSYPDYNLDIDYSLSVFDVYIAAAGYIINGSNSLDLLTHVAERSLCSCGIDSSMLSNMPSWVPDWRCNEVADHSYSTKLIWGRHQCSGLRAAEVRSDSVWQRKSN
jgi:hypothetical protein